MNPAAQHPNDRFDIVLHDPQDLHGDTTGNIDLRDHDPVTALAPSAAPRKGLTRLLRRKAAEAAPAAVHVCPSCGTQATIDLDDAMRGRLYLSCGPCARMWQVKVEPTIHLDEREWMLRD
jgi:hypothetical protein